MNRENIIELLKPFFNIKELVDTYTYKELGEASWCVFDTDTLHALLIQRKILNVEFTINDYKWGGTSAQRGFRSNLSIISKGKTMDNKVYLSGHVLGKAFDYIPKGISAEEARKIIIENKEKLPCKIRFEHKKKDAEGVYQPITWVHFDTKYYNKNPKIYLFNI